MHRNVKIIIIIGLIIISTSLLYFKTEKSTKSASLVINKENYIHISKGEFHKVSDSAILIITKKNCLYRPRDKFHHIQVLNNKEYSIHEPQLLNSLLFNNSILKAMIDSLEKTIEDISPKLKDSIKITYIDKYRKKCEHNAAPCLSRMYIYKSVAKNTLYNAAEMQNATINNVSYGYYSLEKLIKLAGEPDSLIIEETDIGITRNFYYKGILYQNIDDYSKKYSFASIDFKNTNGEIILDGLIINKNSSITDLIPKFPLAYLEKSTVYSHNVGIYENIRLLGMFDGVIVDDFWINITFFNGEIIKLGIVERLT